uniref:Uncharacterized protein n=1 Tax=Meloidogyne incognita TaxID=6306 RepID=A0A914N1P6_MELIC
MDSFYVILPSNTGGVEGNTTSKFTVRMPDTLELDSSWTVALSNIIYPFSFSLFGDSEEQESITVFRRYGSELYPIRIEIPDLSFASEEALEESINAVLLDVWKKELDREREETRLEENKKRIYGEYRKRRSVGSIKEQYDKHGYFDLNSNELNKFIKLLSEEDDAVSPKLTNLSSGDADRNIRLLPPANQKTLYLKVIDKFILPHQTQLEPEEQLIKNSYFDMTKQIAFNFMKFLGKEGIRLPPISPLAVDGIEMVRFNPHSDQRGRIKQALLKFKNPPSVDQTEETAELESTPDNEKFMQPPEEKVVTSIEEAPTPDIKEEEEKLSSAQIIFSLEGATQQLEKDGYLDMPKDLAYKFIQYLNKEIKDAKLPGISPVSGGLVVRLKPQTDQKKPSTIQQPDPLPTRENDQENLGEDTPAGNKEKTQSSTSISSTDDIPKGETPVTIPVTEAPLSPETSNELEKTNDSQQESNDDKTPLDGKITPLSHVEETVEKPSLNNDQKTLLDMAVRAATRAWRNSVELAEQTQINMELGNKYWQNARIKYALKDSVITLKETGETVHIRKTPENILGWVKAQLTLLTNRKIAIEKWTEESLEYGKRASEAQLEAKAAETRGNVTDARKSADRAKAAERKVKEAASQVEEAVAGQKRLSEEIIGKVDAELAKQDKETSPESPTIEDENEELLEENIDENIEEYNENDVPSNKEQWTPPLPEENIEQHKEYESQEEKTEVEDLTPKESQSITDEDKWASPLPDEENIIKEQELPTIIEEVDEEDDTPKESQTITDEDEWTSPLPDEENIIKEQELPTITEEVDQKDETPKESQTITDDDEEQWAPPLTEEDPESILPSTANLSQNNNHPEEDQKIQSEYPSSLPSLPRPEMLIGEPSERPSFLKSFFGHGGVSSEDKKKQELPNQEKVEKEELPKEKLKIHVDDSDPNVKKMHFAKYAYPPEYLKMLLNFSNIQLADPKYQWVSVHFDKLHKRFHVFLQGNVQYIQLSRQLAYTLGFDSEKVHSGQVAKYMPDISGGVRQFLVYAPRLVENSIIGNVTAPLLRVVNVGGKPGESISEVYMTEHHHRLLGKRHPDITIEIRTLTGKLVKFHWGTCILTLHFQRSLF